MKTALAMRQMIRPKPLILPYSKTLSAIVLTMALMLCMGALSVQTYASTGGNAISGGITDVGALLPANTIVPVHTFMPTHNSISTAPITNESMAVTATWIDDEMLRIDVIDLTTMAVSSLVIRLSDFVSDADNSPHILIQAVDLDGNLSGVIKIDNPFYIPQAATPEPTTPPSVPEPNGNNNNGGTQTGGLTPDGTGTVVDNIVTQNSVEFFTVFTEDGSEFFIVVDRERDTDNVYLLNAVTLADLMALAADSGNPIVEQPPISAIPSIPEPTPPVGEPPNGESEDETESETENETESESQASDSGGVGIDSNIFIILIIAAVVGGAGYYFKIVKPKKEAAYDDDDEDFNSDDADEYGYDEAVSEGGDDDFDDSGPDYDGGDER